MTTQITATVYHRKFSTDDGDRHEVGADLGMGYEFATDERGIDPSDPDVVADAYDKAGVVEVEVKDGVEAPESVVYSAWQNGAGHDVESTRSMAVGDVIVIEDVGDDFGFFVDRIGFEEIDVTAFADADGPADPWADDRGLAADVDVVPAAKVGFDPDAVAAAWSLADGVAPSVAAPIASAFATDDESNYFGVAPRDGRFVDRDTVFEDVEGADGATYDIHVEEKAVGVVDVDTDVPGRTYKVELPGDDRRALYVNPAQIFVDKVHDATAP